MSEPQLERKEMDLDAFLEHTRGLLKKGYTLARPPEDGRIVLVTPDGTKELSVTQAVYSEMTGKDPMELNAPDMIREMGVPSDLADRLFEAEQGEDTQWPKYREALEDALGIK